MSEVKLRRGEPVDKAIRRPERQNPQLLAEFKQAREAAQTSAQVALQTGLGRKIAQHQDLLEKLRKEQPQEAPEPVKATGIVKSSALEEREATARGLLVEARAAQCKARCPAKRITPPSGSSSSSSSIASR